jgi:hypothetical protein
MVSRRSTYKRGIAATPASKKGSRAENTLSPKSPMKGAATYAASEYMPDPHDTSITGK